MPGDLENSRVLEAVEALADCSSEDDDAYRAAWERLRLACKDWLTPPEEGRKVVAKAHIRHSFEALCALQVPMGSDELAERLQIDQRSAQSLIEGMKAADLPLRSVRCRDGRRVRYRLDGPKWHASEKRQTVVVTYQLTLWPEERAA